MKEITILRIEETTYEDNTCWIEYKTIGGSLGYEIIDNDYGVLGTQQIEVAFNTLLTLNENANNKKMIDECSCYLAEIIEECRQSENEMWFVELEEIESSSLEKLRKEVKELGIEDYVKFLEDGCAITIYGGVITKFLF